MLSTFIVHNRICKNQKSIRYARCMSHDRKRIILMINEMIDMQENVELRCKTVNATCIRDSTLNFDLICTL